MKTSINYIIKYRHGKYANLEHTQTGKTNDLTSLLKELETGKTNFCIDRLEMSCDIIL
jgi:hypothetical protein